MNIDLERKLKSTRLDSLIEYSARLLCKMFDSDKPYFEVDLVLETKIGYRKGKLTVTSWGISELLYLAMSVTNDFQGIEITDQKFKEIFNYYSVNNNEQTKENIGEPDQKEIYRLLIGLSQQEFYHQEVFRIPQEYSRNYEIMINIPKKIKASIDIDMICSNVVGFSAVEYWDILFAIFAYALKNPKLADLLVDAQLEVAYPVLTCENIRRIIGFYTADYQEYRKSVIKEKYFVVKPIVRTTKNELIVLDIYSLSRKIAEGPFWLIRDYFLKKDSRAFTSTFGEWFEEYVADLLKHYLHKNQFKRVEIDRKERADWIITTTQFNLIVEQKSTSAGILIKRQFPDKKQLETYIDNISKSHSQLKSTIEIVNNKKPIVLISLLYENWFIPNGLIKPYSGIDDNQFILMGIDEFEKIIYLLHRDEDYANSIIQKKMELEVGIPADNRDMSQLLSDVENDYINNKKNNWKNILTRAN